MKKSQLIIIPLVSILIMPTFKVMAAKEMGTMTLNLTGVIDMNVNSSQSQLVTGTLSGQTSFLGEPVYNTSSSSSWNEKYAIISLSQQNYQCNSQFVSQVPNQSNTFGLKLTHSTNSLTSVYVTPKLNYTVNLSNYNSNFANSYAGQFFQPNSGVVDTQSPAQNVCFVPSNYKSKVAGGGKKTLNITSPGLLPVYIDTNLTPGKLTYKGTPFYVGSFGGTNEADFYLKVNVIADIMVKRSCTVTGVSNQQINENMTHTNEVVRDSIFTLSCGGLGNPVNMSAVIKEGSIDPTNANKLVLSPINGTVSDKKPWVIGLPFKQTSIPNLTCANELNSNLLKFNNTEVILPGTNMGNNTPDTFGIKWALCKPEGVKAGEYRGKVDVNIFVRG